MGVTSKMFAPHLLIAAMLVVSSQAGQAPGGDRALQEEDRFSPQFVLDLLIGLVTDIIRDRILNILGITTTQATPILDAFNEIPIIGGLIPDKPTTTTASPTAEGSATTPGAPGPVIGAIGGIIGLPGAIIGGVLPGEPSTTTTTTTTTTPTTTRCGGLIGGGLLGC